MSGLALILIFDVLSAMKEVYAASLLQHIEPPLLIFSCFLTTFLYFNFIHIKDFTLYWESLRKELKNVTWFNFKTLGSWFTFFYAIKYIEPAVASALISALGPIVTIILGKYLRPGSPVLKSEFFASIGIFISILLLGIVTWSGKSGMGFIPNTGTCVGFVAAIICGVCIVGNTFFGKRLNDEGWPATKVMAARFFLLLFVSGLLCLKSSPDLQLLNNYSLGFILIAVFGTIIPLYCLQKGIEKTEPITVALALSIAPLFTFLMQSFDSRLSSSIYSFATIIFILFFIGLGIFSRYGAISWIQERKL